MIDKNTLSMRHENSDLVTNSMIKHYHSRCISSLSNIEVSDNIILNRTLNYNPHNNTIKHGVLQIRIIL